MFPVSSGFGTQPTPLYSKKDNGKDAVAQPSAGASLSSAYVQHYYLILCVVSTATYLSSSRSPNTTLRNHSLDFLQYGIIDSISLESSFGQLFC